jgi:hypothetical protein
MLPTEVTILLDPSLSQFLGFIIITDHHMPYVVTSLQFDKVLDCYGTVKSSHNK